MAKMIEIQVQLGSFQNEAVQLFLFVVFNSFYTEIFQKPLRYPLADRPFLLTFSNHCYLRSKTRISGKKLFESFIVNEKKILSATRYCFYHKLAVVNSARTE